MTVLESARAAATALCRSVVNVAIPHRRGSELPMNAMRLNTVNLLPRDFQSLKGQSLKIGKCCASRSISDNFVTKAARARQGPSGSSMRASAGCALSSRIAIEYLRGLGGGTSRWEVSERTVIINRSFSASRGNARAHIAGVRYGQGKSRNQETEEGAGQDDRCCRDLKGGGPKIMPALGAVRKK